MRMSTKIVDSFLKVNNCSDTNQYKTSTGLNYKLLSVNIGFWFFSRVFGHVMKSQKIAKLIR
jgi:hypothetical protein